MFEDGPSVLKEILEDLRSFWGERDMRAQHQPVWLRQFASDAVVVRRDGVLLGYLLGAVTTHELAYVQLIATRTDHRGQAWQAPLRHVPEPGSQPGSSPG